MSVSQNGGPRLVGSSRDPKKHLWHLGGTHAYFEKPPTPRTRRLLLQGGHRRSDRLALLLLVLLAHGVLDGLPFAIRSKAEVAATQAAESSGSRGDLQVLRVRIGEGCESSALI